MNPQKTFVVVMALVFASLVISFAPAFGQVETAWVRRYSGPGNTYDEANAIAVDSCGNVYVTGCSANGTEYDYVTIKYYPNGDTAWVRRYNGSATDERGGRAIAVCGCDRVYVSGTRGGPTEPESEDITIAYDATDGTQLWIGNYGGVDITVDDFCNIYVTGTDNYNYVTVKYYPNGNTAWVRTYDGPIPGNYWDLANAIAVDDSGNVYVTGGSDSTTTGDPNYSYATVKYDSIGTERWAVRYNGPVNGDDIAHAIAVDNSGYVYVTGESYSGEKHFLGEKSNHNRDPVEWLAHSAPEERWLPPPIWCDYATIKYRCSNGDTVWVRRYDEPGGYSMDWPEDIAVDGSGNVYVTGTAWGDYLTINYLPVGFRNWVTEYNGPGNGWDWAKAITLDDFGCVYITGYSPGNGTYDDYATIKYDIYANLLWTQRYNGPANSADWANDIAVDRSGNVYVTGGSIRTSTSSDFTTIKYIQSGWVYPADPPSFDAPPMKVSPSGTRRISLLIMGICDEIGQYQVTSSDPSKVSIDPPQSGNLHPGESDTVKGTIHCSSEGFINVDITVRVCIGTTEESTRVIPLHAVCSNDYYECDRDPNTHIQINNDVLGLWACVNTEQKVFDARVEDTVVYSGGVIVATTNSESGDPVVGRQDHSDIRTGARNTVNVVRGTCYFDNRCTIKKLHSKNTYIWYPPTSPAVDPKWYWIDIYEDIITYDGTNCPEWKKEQVIKYVWIKKSNPPTWWPNPGTYTGHEDIYLGYFADVNAPFDDGCYGCNTAGYDADRRIMYQWNTRSVYPNHCVGLALTNPTGAVVAPYGIHDVLNRDYLYPQGGWGWNDGELYTLSATAGNSVDYPDSVDDRTMVLTAKQILAADSIEGEFILIEASVQNGLTELQIHIDSTRALIGTQLNSPWGTTKPMDFFSKRFPACGDVNTDDIVNVGDVVYLIGYLFKGGPPPVWPMCRGDVNHDCVIDVGDVMGLINYLFKSGPLPNCNNGVECPVCFGRS